MNPADATPSTGIRASLGWIALLLSVVPPLALAVAVASHALDVPIEDQWGFASEVIAFVRGDYAPAMIFQPVGQHRVVLPKLVMLPLAAATGWDVRAEIWFDFATVVASLLLIADVARRTLRPWWPVAWAWTVPLASAALFSLASWQSWTWGWMMAAYLNVLPTVCVVWALARFGLHGPAPALMTVAAIAASLSFISGLTLLPLVPAALLALPRDDRDVRRGRTIAIVATVLVAAALLYFATYPRGMRAQTAPTLAFRPLDLVLFTVRYVGTPLAAQSLDAAFRWGVAGLVACAASAAIAWRRAPELRAALLPWLLLAAYVVASGVVTGIGRLGAGPQLAIASRYTTISALFWVSLPPCLLLAARAAGLDRASRRARGAALLVAACALLVVANAYLATWERGRGSLLGRSRAIAEGASCLRTQAAPADACLRQLNHVPQLVRRVAAELRPLRLGPFHDEALPPDVPPATP